MARSDGLGGRVLRKLLRKVLGELELLDTEVQLLKSGHASRARQDSARMAELERRVEALERSRPAVECRPTAADWYPGSSQSDLPRMTPEENEARTSAERERGCRCGYWTGQTLLGPHPKCTCAAAKALRGGAA